jgi:glucose-6-phosphate isomerase
MTDSNQLWTRFQQYYREFPAIEMTMDISRMKFDEAFIEFIRPKMAKAISDMAAIDAGAVANTDEKRMVGHYWLRNPALAPSSEIGRAIEKAVADIKRFAAEVHAGRISSGSKPFKSLLLIGIGGSALGPQFVSNALSQPGEDKMSLFFLDNTDPDGMDRVFATLQGKLNETLCIVISKSGGTKETRNGMVEAEAAYKNDGLVFERHVVAITSQGSELDKLASSKGWIARFPMWDWVGGRTSELSAVGLLPAALQGFDIDSMLAGAKACDGVNRSLEMLDNPAAILSAVWYWSGNGKGVKNMVVLPYKDRLELLSKYLQQLIMESLGKALDRDGAMVNQGLTVFGNKGATDQHSYIQQLREGPNDFFATFIVAGVDRLAATLQVEPDVTSGDYLIGFYLGTRQALYESGRESVTIGINQVSAFSVGVLIALFERAVGLYASLVNINAYHQPGVEAGKKAAAVVLALQTKVIEALRQSTGREMSIAEIAVAAGAPEQAESVFWICSHLAANGRLKESPGALSARKYAYIN